MNKQILPHAQSSLVFGILSIITSCCCFGVPGIIFGIIGLNNSNRAYALLEQNPGEYSGEDNANTGKITSIIGLIIGGLIVANIIYLFSNGEWTEVIEQFEEGMRQGMEGQ